VAWDFSLIYAKDRESHQREKFTETSARIRFEWDAHPDISGSHHQKFAVVDGAIGFVGGIDLCDARWDDCEHLTDDPDRVNVVGDPCKPYHDVQACFTGPIVTSLLDVFSERWQRACGERLHLPLPDAKTSARFDVQRLSHGTAEPICAKYAALSRTQVDSRATPERIGEILSLFADAIASAQGLIYAETQYFTSRSVGKVLLERMRDATLPKLEVVVILPHGADTPMEKFALEDTQEGVLLEALAAARDHGHAMRLLYPASRSADGSETATFIHSKILIVDDRLLLVGSPNFTERSVALDTELAITWECASEDDALRHCIRDVRTKLLAEHSGAPEREFTEPRGLCAKLDTLLARGNTRLRVREVHAPGPLGAVLAPLFDPGDSELTTEALGAPN
jgi:phosphatidylserine/phosphatidylglycerophosphate/cardiolipin synthase-like enzyme